MRLKLAPSLMNMDLLDMKGEIAALDTYADYYHVDILDWHYVKNMCLTPHFIEAVRSVTSTPIEAHLYVDNIEEDLILLCLDAGATTVTMPSDVIGRQVNHFCSLIHGRGAKVGVFLNPSQRADVIEPYAAELDNLLVLSVDPGFTGQSFIPSSLDKIEAAQALRARTGSVFQISVDGSCNESNYAALARAGADAVVLGRGLFERDGNTRTAIELTHRALEETERQIVADA